MDSKHALIIDDNVANVDVLAELLIIEGVASTKVHLPKYLDGVLEHISNVDVIFLDLEMPGQNGYQIFNALKADPRFRDVPIIVYSVLTTEINTVRQMGFHGFLSKPLDADDFSEQLASILRGESVWAIA